MVVASLFRIGLGPPWLQLKTAHSGLANLFGCRLSEKVNPVSVSLAGMLSALTALALLGPLLWLGAIQAFLGPWHIWAGLALLGLGATICTVAATQMRLPLLRQACVNTPRMNLYNQLTVT